MTKLNNNDEPAVDLHLESAADKAVVERVSADGKHIGDVEHILPSDAHTRLIEQVVERVGVHDVVHILIEKTAPDFQSREERYSPRSRADAPKLARARRVGDAAGWLLPRELQARIFRPAFEELWAQYLTRATSVRGPASCWTLGIRFACVVLRLVFACYAAWIVDWASSRVRKVFHLRR